MVLGNRARSAHTATREEGEISPRDGEERCRRLAVASCFTRIDGRMDVSLDLLLNAIISGLLLGGFYAAVSLGVAISFGLLDIVNIAHPAFILLGSYVAFIANTTLGIDPILATVI